jgi:DNA-binding transcriptional ArsR family regulator
MFLVRLVSEELWRTGLAQKAEFSKRVGTHMIAEIMRVRSPTGCQPFLKAMADETRWKIVRELLCRSLTVGELSSRLKVSQYNTSKHLRILREAGIVEADKDGRHLRCHIAPDFRRRVNKDNHQLDLGCCTFRFEK